MSHKKTYLILLLLLSIQITPAAQTNGCNLSTHSLIWNPQEVNYEHGDWVLVYEDEFNNNTLDNSKWFTCGDGWLRIHGEELQVYLDENVILNNGVVSLVAKREPGRYKINTDISDTTTRFFDYTSGWIQSKSSFQYGLFEVRCRIPSGRGFWPAFWLYGNDEEIDVFEFDCEYTRKDNTCIHLFSGDVRYSCHDDYNDGTSYDEDYHVYSLEWNECALIYRVDGHVIRTFYRYTNTSGQEIPNYLNLPFHEWCYEKRIFPTKSKHLILNLAIPCGNGCDWPGLPPDNNTQFPSSLDIDYVRVYKRANPTRNIDVCSLNSQKGDYYTGRNISIGNCPIIIDSNQTLVVVATDKIVLNQGLSISHGAVFDAHINDSRDQQPIIQDIEDVSIKTFVNETSEDQAGRLISVNPNPSHGVFTISLLRPALEYRYIKIIDAAGNNILFMD